MPVCAENLYYLLSYAWRCFEEAEAMAISTDVDADAEQILVRALCAATQRLLVRQLDRGYREERDELRRPRGRIDVSLALARSSRARGVLPCAFDELSASVLHNQILRSMLLRVAVAEGVHPKQRVAARALAAQMGDVEPVALADHHFQRLQLGANLRRYRLSLGICGLLHHCLLPHPTTGAWQLQSFSGDDRAMGHLFEAYVRAFLEQHNEVFPEVRRSALKWRTEGDTAGLLPALETDVTLRRPGQTVVIESKCYTQPLVRGAYGETRRVRSENVCQLAAYLANIEPVTGRLTGVLLYAVDKPTVPAARFWLLGHDVLVREINIGQPWRDIERDMLALVAAIATEDAGPRPPAQRQ